MAQIRGRKSLYYEPIRSHATAEDRRRVMASVAELSHPLDAVEQIVAIIRTVRGDQRMHPSRLGENCT